MADVRSVVVRLSAETSQYISKMTQAGAVTETSMGRAERSSKKAAVGLTEVERAGLAGAVVLAGKAVFAAADFESAMSSVEAATHGSAAEMESLRQAALDAGADTVFSATEAAAGIENLAKAGVSTADIMGGALAGSLDLAAAGQLSVADAAEYTATALTQFQLAGDQATHVADLLAAGAGKAQGEVSDMALALSYAGVPASNLGVSIEETAGSIALLAKNGIIGEKAGTALRGMLGSIGSPSKQAAKEMERLGINVFDAQGKFVGFEGVAGELQSRLAGLTQQEREQALGRIFGNEQAAAAGVFFREGAAGVAEMTKAVDDNGYAAETAAIKLDNLKGDVEQLGGALETALIGSGDSSQTSLRTTTQLLTELVNVMSQVNEQSAIQGATDQLSIINSDAAQIGLSNLQKVTDALFGSKDATDAAADAADEKAAADTEAANAAAQVAVEVQQSAEELKAQEEAYEKARKAASDTATEFFNLGESLNDASVSLDDWIRQMADQADALNNFTSNAERAAKKGLKDGLIAALKEAGPEGALRMRQLANATEAEIDRANGAWSKGQKAINRYVDATAGVPGSVSSTLYLDSAGAMRDLAIARQKLDELDGRKAQSIMEIVTVYKTVGNVTDAIAPKRRASGGQVFGPGTSKSDSIPAMLSNREYVIQADAVDYYGVGFFDAANAMRLADGGQPGMKDGKRKGGPQAVALPDGGLQNWLKEQLRLTEKMSKAADKGLEAAERQADAAQGLADSAKSLLDSTQAQSDAFAASVAGNFNNDVFGKGLDAAMLQLSADTNDASAFEGLLRSLSGSGLNGAAFQALAGSGDLNTAQQLATGGQASIDAFESAYAARSAAQSSVGSFAAGEQFGAQLQAQTIEFQKLSAAAVRQANAADLQATVVRQLEQRLSMLEGAVERGAEKGTRAGNSDKDTETKQRGRAGR